MAERKGPLGKTAAYRVDSAARYRVRYVGAARVKHTAVRESCKASRKARNRPGAPAHRRLLLCMLGI